MRLPRTARRFLVGASLAASLAMAGCGGGGGTDSPGGDGSATGAGSASGGADLTKQGPTEYWAGKDTSGNLRNLIDQFNRAHPEGRVTFHELPDNADAQRQQILQNTQIKNPAMGVLSMDVVWTAEFAANQWVEALPADQFPTDKFLPATVDSATYFDKLYAYPFNSGAGMLYYRKDLLSKYGLKPPTTWDEMKQACRKIKSGENNRKLECYAGQYQKYEGLTANFAEAVNSAGGSVIGPDGKPSVNSPEAAKGLSFLVESFRDGTIPKGAVTWQEEQGRQAFQNGDLVFHRNWPYVYALASKQDGSSKVVGQFAVAPLPGLAGPGVSSLGGHNLAIAKNAANKGTAADFVKFMSDVKTQKSNTLATSSAPVSPTLFTDAEVVKKFPYMPTLLKAIETAKPRPKAVKYGDVTLAIQNAAYGAPQGQTPPDEALSGLQTKLESVTQ